MAADLRDLPLPADILKPFRSTRVRWELRWGLFRLLGFLGFMQVPLAIRVVADMAPLAT